MPYNRSIKTNNPKGKKMKTEELEAKMKIELIDIPGGLDKDKAIIVDGERKGKRITLTN